MGVDFYACDICHDTFPDCGDYVSCECGGKFCSNDCASMDYAVYDDNGECIEGEDGEGNCVLCRGEAATDYDLIEFLLEKCSLTREQAVEELFKK